MSIRFFDLRTSCYLGILFGVLSLNSCSLGGTGGGNDINSKFDFTQPLTGTKITGNVSQEVSLMWTSQGSPVAAQPVTFTTSLGNLINAAGQASSMATVITGSDGTASIKIISATTGSATITATAADPVSGGKLSTSLLLNILGAPSALTTSATSPIAVNSSSIVSAVVKDSTGNLLPGVTLDFALISSGGGNLSAASATTDSSGTASVVFTPAGASAETETIGISGTSLTPQQVTIQVTPTGAPPPVGTLTFSPCPATIPAGSTTSCTVVLVDGSGQAISGTTVMMSASAGTVTPTSGSTGTDGTFAFSYAAPSESETSTQTTATLTASGSVNATTVSQTFNISLAPSAFSFTQPMSRALITENVQQPLTLQWTSGGNPVASQPVMLSTTQGDLIDASQNIATSLTETTGSDGTVMVNLLTSTTGAVTITATAEDKTSGASISTSLSLKTVGPPSSLTASAPSPIQANGSSVVTAVVKDAAGNTLPGVTVDFALQSGGGGLSVASGSTDDNGTVLSLFTPDGSESTITITVTVPPLAAQMVTVTITG